MKVIDRRPLNTSSIRQLPLSENHLRLALTLFLSWSVVCTGCAVLLREKPPEEKIFPELIWNLESYAAFVKQNMKEINAKYSIDYVPYEFVVDTENGSTVIQNLIEPKAGAAIGADLETYSNSEDPDKLIPIYQYVINEYNYILEPFEWQTVEETIKTKKGDCKSLSLLLMSLLLSANYDAYAAISNGHMWINVYENYQWHVLELDHDPERNKIYRIPGFYENPLFRIFPNHSEKRKKRN
jgi:hypothetical protein